MIAGRVAGPDRNRGWADTKKDLSVFVIPIYDDRPRLLDGAVAIPMACAMVVADRREDTQEPSYDVRCWMMPNATDIRGPVTRFQVSLHAIQKATGWTWEIPGWTGATMHHMPEPWPVR
jgi:hypothetical protein